jgi:transaldolase
MIKIFADGANIAEILELNKDNKIEGFTTNPTLMKASGIEDYTEFAKKVIGWVDRSKPISFEVIADDLFSIERQAMEISSWGENVYVKIPITRTQGEPNYNLMSNLSSAGIKINATAVMDFDEINMCIDSLNPNVPSIISVFAGRIADTGRNPELFIKYAAYKKKGKQEILWASCREVYNYVQADFSGADIITIPPAIYKKMKSQWRKPLPLLSLETVQMFYNDAFDSGYKL